MRATPIRKNARMTTDRRDSIAGGFTETASDYDGAVRFNIEGAQRLVMLSLIHISEPTRPY